MQRQISCVVFGCLLALGSLAGCGKRSDGRLKLAFVTNGPASFWTVAEAGTKAAEKDFDVTCDYRTPKLVADQNRTLEELVARGVKGIAVSPIDGVNQQEAIDAVCERVALITHDSDAPGSKRRCYIGVDNYVAGRQCGELVKKALPGGGQIMIFVGRLEQDNARLRRQGVIDELLGRTPDRSRYDEPGQKIEGNGYVILDTRTDGFDEARAKSNAEDAIALYSELDAMIGLFAYNPPACLGALKGADKVGQIKVIAFDEAEATLQGIIDGEVFGTIVQQPYKYGYESVRILAGLARGDESVLPEGGFLEIPALTIGPENVVEFREELHRLLSEVEGG